MAKNKGVLVVFSGPSGCGKGTVRKLLFERYPELLAFSVSCTTRAPRAGEQDGVDYHFISQPEFDKMAGEGAFLEYARFVNKSYGTPLAPIRSWMDAGINPILEIEVLGAAQVKKKMPDSISIFLMPPSMEELEHRLRNRGTEPEDVISGRLARAREELRLAERYDYQVVNDDPAAAADEIAAIIAACQREKESSKMQTKIFHPADDETGENYYSYVMGIAKRARDIVDNHEDSDRYHTVKPVKMSEDEFNAGMWKVVNP